MELIKTEKMEKTSGILGAIVCVVCAVVLGVKLFGGYPPSYFNWVWFGGTFIGALMAAPLFGKKSN